VRLLPPTDDHPASMLRWVRGVELFKIPLGLVMALLLHEQGLGAWWIGLVVAALGLIGFATIGPATRRAEEHGPNDPATRPARLRRDSGARAVSPWASTVARASWRSLSSR
jgi:hypothetical protein